MVKIEKPKQVQLSPDIDKLLQQCSERIAPGVGLKYPQILKTIALAYLGTQDEKI